MKIFLSLLILVLSSYTFAGDHNHHVAVFTGATHSHELSYGTFGIDYEYKFSDMWGIGGLYENVQTDPSATIVLLTSSLHLDDFMFTAGIGKEEVHGHSEGLKRLGAAYHFHFSSFTVAPSLNYDFIDDGNSAVVYGILWGVGF